MTQQRHDDIIKLELDVADVDDDQDLAEAREAHPALSYAGDSATNTLTIIGPREAIVAFVVNWWAGSADTEQVGYQLTYVEPASDDERQRWTVEHD